MVKVKIKSTGDEAVYKTETDVNVFYDTGADEIGIIGKEQIPELEKEIIRMEAFLPYMKVFLEEKKGEDEKQRTAKVKAILHVMSDFANARSDEEAQRIIDSLDQLISDIKQEILKDEETYNKTKASGHKLKSGDIQEVFWVNAKRMVRVRGEKIRSHNRWMSKKQVLQQIKKEKTEADKKKSQTTGPAKELEIKIFEKKIMSVDGSFSPEIEEFNSKCNINFFDESEVFDASIGAQFLRYSAEASFGATANWKEDKAIKVGGKAEGSFALAQAHGSFTIQLPNENGFGLFGFLRDIDPELVKDDFTELFFRVKITTQGSAFVGACASISMDLGVSMKEKDKSGGVEAGLNLFAGAKTGADITLALDAKIVNEDDYKKSTHNAKTQRIQKKSDTTPESTKENGKWESLSEVTLGAWAALGIGVEASIKLGYFDNRIRYHAKIGLVVKAGAGTYVKGTINPEQCGRVIWTIAQSMNWTHLGDVFQNQIHDLYQGIMLNCFLAGKKVDEVYQELVQTIDAILSNTMVATESGLGALKSADDTFDENIPGYSGYKQYNVGFLLLKSSYYYLQAQNKQYSLKMAAIETVETSQREKRWKYATWQMKVNLIYDMRIGGSGLGGFSEERKENAVLTVLESARHDYEFDKILRSLKEPGTASNRKSVLIEDLLDFSQKTRFKQLKGRFNFNRF